MVNTDINSRQWMPFVLFYLCLGLIALESCRDETIITDPSATIQFSEDTLRFDTVFTELGSATRAFRIFNNNDQAIRLSKLFLEFPDGNDFFRLNVDGVPGVSFEDVDILGNDSLWVFVEVTIDPDNPLSQSPFVIEDRVIVNVNGNEEFIRLEAWGQNANYFPSRFNGGVDSFLSCDMGQLIFDDPKPYVIYGRLIIDSCELVLPAGTHVYVHGGVVSTDSSVYNDGLLVFGPNARLKSLGEQSAPVIIQADRLEPEFEDIPGQWTGLWFLSGSIGNVMSHTTIKNSLVGFRADSLATVVMDKCVIKNTSGTGIVSLAGNILCENSLIHSSGGNGLQLTYGGSYDFRYTTVASYSNQSEALRVNNYFCTDPLCLGEIRSNPVNASFTNCIFVGSSDDELLLEDITDGEAGMFNYGFSHCIVKVEELLDSEQFADFFQNCENCYNLQFGDPLFFDIDMDDYHLDTLSVAENRAINISGISDDLDGNLRDLNTPDIGCYEYQY